MPAVSILQPENVITPEVSLWVQPDRVPGPPEVGVPAVIASVTVEESVATPLEQQMNGVDNMLYMQSINGNDGTMQLQVTFDVDTDPNIDQVNVQNRMAQAQPNLPSEVSNFPSV